MVFKHAPELRNIRSVIFGLGRLRRETSFMTNSLIWTGLACCLAALGLQLFPDLAFRIGAEPAAAWLVFGFGVFLMLIAAMMSSGGRQTGRKAD